MRAVTIAGLGLALCAGCAEGCSGHGDGGAASSSQGTGGGALSAASADSSVSSTSASMQTADERLRARLAPVVAQLTQPPFGTAAAVTAVHGPVSATVAGGALWDGGPAAGEATRFNVASISKLLTAARVVSLAHAGSLGLDDPLSTHLPGVALVDEAGADRSDHVTIRALLGHRGGLPKQPSDLEAKVEASAGGDWSSPDLLQKITASWEIDLAGTPGDYLYSNLGYALLGAIIERMGECTFANCMDTYLAELGMAHSTFWPATLDGDAAHGRVVVDGSAEFLAPTWYGSRYAIPFTGLWTTMPDLAGFGRKLAAASADAASDLFAMADGEGHGLGPIHGERLGSPSLEHDGGSRGFYAWLVVVPERQIALALATNGGNEAKAEVEALTEIVASAVNAVPEE